MNCSCQINGSKNNTMLNSNWLNTYIASPSLSVPTVVQSNMSPLNNMISGNMYPSNTLNTIPNMMNTIPNMMTTTPNMMNIMPGNMANTMPGYMMNKLNMGQIYYPLMNYNRVLPGGIIIPGTYFNVPVSNQMVGQMLNLNLNFRATQMMNVDIYVFGYNSQNVSNPSQVNPLHVESMTLKPGQIVNKSISVPIPPNIDNVVVVLQNRNDNSSDFKTQGLEVADPTTSY